MHGIIMNHFRRFVIDRLGRDAWPELTRAAEVPLPDEPLALGTIYPDEYLAALLPVASRTTGIAVEALLEDFGSTQPGPTRRARRRRSRCGYW